MCTTRWGFENITQYCASTLWNALNTRARNIRFNRHKPSSKREYYWAKQRTFAEAYGFQGPFISRMSFKNRWRAEG